MLLCSLALGLEYDSCLHLPQMLLPVVCNVWCMAGTFIMQVQFSDMCFGMIGASDCLTAWPKLSSCCTPVCR